MHNFGTIRLLILSKKSHLYVYSHLYTFINFWTFTSFFHCLIFGLTNYQTKVLIHSLKIVVFWVASTFKLVYGHLNSIFWPGILHGPSPYTLQTVGKRILQNFKFLTPAQRAAKRCGILEGVIFLLFGPHSLITCFLGHTPLLPAFWATLPYYLLFGPHPIITAIKN